MEVPGEDYEPNDTAGWTAPGRRTKRLGTEQKAGESISSSEHQARSRERVSCAKRVTARITKAARMPALPREEAKIIMRPRGGLNIARTEATTIMKAVVAAAQINNKEARQDTVCLNPSQNILVISTPNEQQNEATDCGRHHTQFGPTEQQPREQQRVLSEEFTPLIQKMTSTRTSSMN